MTVTVFTRSVVAVVFVTAVTVNVAVPPTARFTVALMSVVSGPVGVTDDPAEADAVHVQLAMFGFVEKMSDTVAPVTAPFPVFDTRIVYVTVSPGR